MHSFFDSPLDTHAVIKLPTLEELCRLCTEGGVDWTNVSYVTSTRIGGGVTRAGGECGAEPVRPRMHLRGGKQGFDCRAFAISEDMNALEGAEWCIGNFCKSLRSSGVIAREPPALKLVANCGRSATPSSCARNPVARQDEDSGEEGAGGPLVPGRVRD